MDQSASSPDNQPDDQPGDRPGRPDGAPADPVAAAVAGLRAADRAMAAALRAIAAAGPVEGMPADRVIALSASSTGWDLRFLRGVIDTLRAMPHMWAAFDDGRISWAQLRGVVGAARNLRVADRGRLDRGLVAAVEENPTSEPERLVETAEDLAARLDERRTVDRERSARSRSWVAFQGLLDDPGADVRGYIGDPAALAEILTGLNAAADPPAGDDPAVDDDGTPLPRSWQAGTSRAAQHAEALRRVCTSYLTRFGTGTVDDDDTDGTDEDSGAADDTAGDSAAGRDVDATAAQSGRPAGRGGAGMPKLREARHALYAVCDISQLPDLAGYDLDTNTAVTPRILWQLAGGRTATSTARVHQLACDAMRIPVLTDGATILAVGDAHDPIGLARRRAVVVRDQGCRMPGCSAPAAHTDVHHVCYRTDGGATELDNLVALCRSCHTDVHTHGWRLRLHPDGRLTVTIGRRTFTSRPPLRPPRGDPPDRDPPAPTATPATTGHNGEVTPGQPPDTDTGSHADADAAILTNATEPLPF